MSIRNLRMKMHFFYMPRCKSQAQIERPNQNLLQTVKMALHSKSEVLSNIKQNSKQILLHSVLRRNLTKVWKTWTGLLLGPKFYKIRNTINNFQKMNFKHEVYMTLKNNSLYSLYSIMKVGFQGVDLESMILSESGKAKVQQANMFQNQ